MTFRIPVVHNLVAPWETPSSKGRPAGLCRALFVLAALSFFGMPALAEDVHVSIATKPHGIYRVDGFFSTTASRDIIWSTLTDYNHLANFVPSMRKSQSVQTSTSALVVHQQASASALGFFRRQVNVSLNVTEQLPDRIVFEDISRKDFTSYEGYWEIEPAVEGSCRVHYHLDAQPKFFAPAFVGRGAMRKNVADLLTSVRQEILRRAPPSHGPDAPPATLPH